MQFKRPIVTPETYADIFTELTRLEAISPELAATMVRMVRFRNRLVHMYWEVDPHQIHEILRERLDDLVIFREGIVRYLEREPTFADQGQPGHEHG
jgi:uncharacterized protein YutE (UPF0331/DUF86 family)